MIFEELANERLGQIQNLSKQISFDNLIYEFKSDKDPKDFIRCKGSLVLYQSIRVVIQH